MSAALRIILILTLIFALTDAMCAQETATTETNTTSTAAETTATGTAGETGDAVTETATDTTDTTATDATTTATTTEAEEVESSVERTRNEFREVLNQYSNQMSTVLALEPSLLSNDEFLKGHPDLAAFIAAHPEVAQHPSAYLDAAELRQRSAFGEILESLIIFGIIIFIAAVLAWFVRTVIEQKRWSRLTSQQSEVHNKILDRFGNTEELLGYIRTPAGTKFLESAPIPLHAERPTRNAPLTRVMLSIQIGVVVAAAALGMLLVSFRFDRDTAADLFALGTIGFCVGAGFIVSALVSLFLSRRLAVWGTPVDDADIVK
jgi:cytoskeletal protein RodZ